MRGTDSKSMSASPTVHTRGSLRVLRSQAGGGSPVNADAALYCVHCTLLCLVFTFTLFVGRMNVRCCTVCRAPRVHQHLPICRERRRRSSFLSFSLQISEAARIQRARATPRRETQHGASSAHSSSVRSVTQPKPTAPVQSVPVYSGCLTPLLRCKEPGVAASPATGQSYVQSKQ